MQSALYGEKQDLDDRILNQHKNYVPTIEKTDSEEDEIIPEKSVYFPENPDQKYLKNAEEIRKKRSSGYYTYSTSTDKNDSNK